MGAILKRVAPVLGLGLFLAALWVLHHELRAYHYRDLQTALRTIPVSRIALACLLTFLGYLSLATYDAVALRYIGRSVATRRSAMAAFTGFALSHTLGFSALTGGSIRLRLYGAWGLSTSEIARVVAFVGLTTWIGFLFLAGAAFVLEPLALPSAALLPAGAVRAIGVVFLSILAVYLAWTVRRRPTFAIRGVEIAPPSVAIACTQVLLGSLDWGFAAATLYVLLPEGLPFPWFAGVFLLAQLGGIASQVPGGVGVFETLLLLLLKDRVEPSAIAGAILVYRAVYYLLPMAVATVLLGAREVFTRREPVSAALARIGRVTPLVVPNVLAATTFAGGVVLLLSGATPAAHGRLRLLESLLPLPVIEVSHLLGSISGVGLLLLARSIQRRIDAAWLGTVAVLAAGIVTSLLKGLDWEEALVLAAMLLVVLPCRRHFFRRSSLLEDRFSPRWLTTIAIAVIGMIWLGRFTFKHAELSSDLLWTFELHGEASRFLRASVAVAAIAVLLPVARLLRATGPRATAPVPADLDRAQAIARASGRTDANLALLGDKSFLFSDSGAAFVMYGVSGKSWISMGDPVGPPSEWPALLWGFKELADRHGGWTVGYGVDAPTIHLYVDIGLSLLKIGEEARVPLSSFSLEGSAQKELRHVLRKMEKAGVRFEIVPQERIAEILPELERISNAWLGHKKTREKGFSLGFFDRAYVARFPAAIVRNADGRIVAFANLWQGAAREELSVDLMRYDEDAPKGVMDYLFGQLMIWGKAEGFLWFNLGMAPLSGLEDRSLAPLWNRIGALAFRHGEHFYNFQGLRQYKEKFAPVWEPRYLASPGGLALPLVLTNIASLVSGGIQGVLTR